MNNSIKNQRRNIIEAAYRARQGHLSSSMSILEIINVLFKKVMVFDAAHPDAYGNDRFVLSKGHASLALYALLLELGCITKEEFFSFSEFDSKLGEHPDRNKVPAVDISSGSLGHGLPCAVGMAAGFKAQKKPNKVYVIIGDGEANEGSIWEAAALAAQLKLNNIVCIVDDNNSASHTDSIGNRFKAFGWDMSEVDGHDVGELEKALSSLNDKPLFIWAHTVKGHGCSLMEKDPEGWHHRVVSEEEYKVFAEELK